MTSLGGRPPRCGAGAASPARNGRAGRRRAALRQLLAPLHPHRRGRYLLVPEAATGLAAGSPVRYAVPLVARAAPFIQDQPAAEAFASWEEACAAAGCPERLEVVRLPLDQAVGRVTAEPVWATRSSPPFDAAAMDGIAVHSRRHGRRGETSPVRSRRARSRSSTRATRFRRLRRRRHARGRARGRGRSRAAGGRRAVPARAVDRRGRERRRAAAPGRPPAARGRRGGRGRRGRDRAGGAAPARS